MVQKTQDCRLGVDSSWQNWGQAAMGTVVSCIGHFSFLLVFLNTSSENDNKDD